MPRATLCAQRQWQCHSFTSLAYRPADAFCYCSPFGAPASLDGASTLGCKTKTTARVHATTAHIISPASGANFAFSLARLSPPSAGAGTVAAAGPAPPGVERLVFVVDGALDVKVGAQPPVRLGPNGYAYVPAANSSAALLTTAIGCNMVVVERVYSAGGTMLRGCRRARLLPHTP